MNFMELSAQEKDLKFIHLTTENGLSSSECTSIVQDKEGFIWIGTADGLNRYDGRTFRIYRRIAGDTTSLPENHIKALFIDSRGELWIVPDKKGICRYNKEKDYFLNYIADPVDSTTIMDNSVSGITEDAMHQIWISSFSGLSLYNRKDNNYTRFAAISNPQLTITEEGIRQLKQQINSKRLLTALERSTGKKTSLNEWFDSLRAIIDSDTLAKYRDMISLAFNDRSLATNDLRCLVTDARGIIYIGYADGILSAFDPETSKFRHYRFTTPKERNLVDFFITSICFDDHKIWIGTRGEGIWIFDAMSAKWTKFSLLQEPFVNAIIKDVYNNIWIGGSSCGLVTYDRHTNSIARYGHNEVDKYSLSNNNISCIYEDKQKSLWVGTNRGDVNFTDKQNPFRSLNELISNTISTVMVDDDNILWIGYYNEGGIEIIDLKTGKEKYYAPLVSGLGKGTVQCIFQDSRSNIWVGTYLGGLQIYDRKKHQFTGYVHDPGEENSIGGNNIRMIAEDRQGNLWLAIHGAGIDRFNATDNRFKHYRTDYNNLQNSIQSDWSLAVYCDHNDNVWIGTIGGISVIEPKSGTIRHYSNEANNPKSLSSNFVYAIYQDSKDRMWFGTTYGLNLLDPESGTFTLYTSKEGLANDNISGIIEDHSGNLWVTTYKGLSKFNPATKAFKNFDVWYGLKTDEFIAPCGVVYKNNELFLGGHKGLVIFNPDSIKTNNYIPPVYLTDMKLFNHSVSVSIPPESKEFYLEKLITFTDKLTLPYDQNVITFEFVALNYLQPLKNQYAYLMEGFDEQWNFIGGKNEVTYTNLKPGSYIFRVKASNNDGVWNEEGTSVKVTIRPPWWRTAWAYVVYSAVLVLLLIWFRYQILQHEKNKRKHELDMMKLRFFTNISHEFRTPLTLIMAPIEKLIQTVKDRELKSQYALIYRNVRHLFRLINQLMDFRKLEAGGLKLELAQIDIIHFIKEIAGSFNYEAQKRYINYQFITDLASLYIASDPDKLDKIFTNLIANAFKFTPDGKSITIQISVRKKLKRQEGQRVDFVEIVVKDTGVGMPPEALSRIFERFYQAENARMSQGTGIGLALTKELVELHHGEIGVDGEIGGGARFTVLLPIDNEHLQNYILADKRQDYINRPDPTYIDDREFSSEIMKTDQNDESIYNSTQPLLLIIEDNLDLRLFIKYEFINSFTIIEADDGIKGYEKAIERIPDIIISDIMMPGMDGVELCKKLKTDERTSHIPIVILTARTDEEQIVEGLETGADDYITKPFKTSVLRVRVKNLIESRRLLRKQFSKLPIISTTVTTSKLDQQFLEKTIQITEAHISQSEFDAHQFAAEIGMSRAQLYRKIHALTGCTVNEFIRNVRLKKAAELFVNEKYNISETAYMVGFSHASYFSKCFTQYYGESPSKFISRHRK